MKEEYRIIKSMNYKDMIPMFIEADLEIEPDEEAPEGLLSCFEMFDKKSGKRIGGASLVKTCEEYVLRTVVIEKEYRGMGLGRILVERVLKEAREWDASRLLLTAKVPEFYKKLGFRIISRSDAPPISDCSLCHRFHNGCDSEIMEFRF